MHLGPHLTDKIRRAAGQAVSDLGRVEGIDDAARATITITCRQLPLAGGHCEVAVSTTCDTAPFGMRDRLHAGGLGFCNAEEIKPDDVLLFPVRQVMRVIACSDPLAPVKYEVANSGTETHDPDAILLVFRPDTGYGAREHTCEQCGADTGETCDPFCTALPALGDTMKEVLAANKLMLDHD